MKEIKDFLKFVGVIIFVCAVISFGTWLGGQFVAGYNLILGLLKGIR